MSQPLVLTIADLRMELPCSEHLARQIAHELGIRVGKRLLVPRVRLEAWLQGEGHQVRAK